VNNQPIFEAVPFSPKLIQAMPGGVEYSYRRESHNTMDWSKVPHDRLDRVELYFDRAFKRDQPAIVLERVPGAKLRFFQLKMGSLVANAGLNVAEQKGQVRTGIVGYRLGYYNETLGFAQMWEIRKHVWQIKEHPIVGHPCWPRPLGYGLAPFVLGLTDSDVPPAPGGNAGGDGKGLITTGT
jgi:hypothetical protein